MITRIVAGIDVSKTWFDACVLQGRTPTTQRFANDPEGCAAFVVWVRERPARAVWVCMEHTGGYETLLATTCLEAGLATSLVDGATIRGYRKSFGRARPKTDKLDARLIARYCRERRPPVWTPRPDAYRLLAELARHRQDLVGQRKAWACRAAGPAQIELVSVQRRCQIDVLNAQLDETHKAIRDLVRSSQALKEDAELLQSIDGIAWQSAVNILAEMGPVANYRTPRDLALYAGLAPIAWESGTSSSGSRLPVYGNRELRNALYMPVIVAMRLHRGVAHFTSRVKANGDKKNKTVITAGMRKLAHLVHGVLTHRTPYSEDTFLKDMKTNKRP